MKKSTNPVIYFEIPVTNMDRAIKFYKSVFGFTFKLGEIHGNEMAFFPFNDQGLGITGALAKGEIYKPTKNGVLIYFDTGHIDKTLDRVIENGGKILFPKTPSSEDGFVAEFEDSEGNRIALTEESN